MRLKLNGDKNGIPGDTRRKETIMKNTPLQDHPALGRGKKQPKRKSIPNKGPGGNKWANLAPSPEIKPKRRKTHSDFAKEKEESTATIKKFLGGKGNGKKRRTSKKSHIPPEKR